VSVFADRLMEAVEATGAPLCVGIDPFPALIPKAVFGDALSDTQALVRFGEAVVAEAVGVAAAVKPQLGLFETFGPEGYGAARAVCGYAQSEGLQVILDAKRGDIGSTAEGYARGCLGPLPGFDADCVTVNPYMGADTLSPFLDLAEARGKGVAVLVRTSNPGARHLQDLSSEGEPIWAHTAAMIAPFAEALKGASGWSGLMAVAGATYPQEAKALRALLPNCLFLVPGYGAQGAGAADAVAGFVRTPSGLRGGVVNSSRGVCYPPGAENQTTLSGWKSCIGLAMQKAKDELSRATAG
jgi:orotidine-5'-phosphate decarboxylase